MKCAFTPHKQLETMDCGPNCLRMVAKYYGRSIPLEYLRLKTEYGKEGSSLLGPSFEATSVIRLCDWLDDVAYCGEEFLSRIHNCYSSVSLMCTSVIAFTAIPVCRRIYCLLTPVPGKNRVSALYSKTDFSFETKSVSVSSALKRCKTGKPFSFF